MKSLSEIIKILMPLLPLKIISIVLTGEQLIISGENWSIGLSTAWWRVVQDGRFLFGYEEYDDKKIKDLEGLSIIEVSPQSKYLKSDLAIVLSNGCIIETFSTSALEPWNIGINEQIFYADPSNLEWNS
ncbi:MAG: hypothetical protein QM763_08315 [Agriterribacter sp.]